MAKHVLQEKYYQLLKLHVARPQEKQLAEAAELGRKLVLENIPIEEIAELHEQALHRLGQDIPDIKLLDSARLISAPLIELLMSYGMACRELSEKQKRAQETVRKLSRAVEQSPASIIITDTDGSIEYVNPKFTEVTGYTQKEVLGKNPRFLKSGKTPPEEYHRLWQTIASGKEWRGEFHNQKKNGERYWESASISPITNDEGKITHFLAVKEDTTARKYLERQLLQAQKMEAIGTLAGGVAHDFNNLLTVILGNAEFGMQDSPPDEPVYQELIRIENAAKQARVLTNQLLSFSRHQVLQPQVLKLNEGIEHLCKMLNRIIGEDIEMRTELAPKLAPVWADPAQIQQVLMNLAVNARAAMPRGGQLLIKTRNFVAAPNTIPIEIDQMKFFQEPEKKPGNYVELTVTDTGVGMDKETRARIFEPFFTTKEVGKGTGLGLAVVYGIVKQHEGFIQVDSELGKGATFKIYFPALSESDSIKHKKKKIKTIPRGNETILIGEDEEAVLSVTVRILDGLGYKVFSAHDGREVLQVFKENAENIDLVLLDVVMPVSSGLESYKKMISIKPGLPVIFLTGYDVNDEIAELDNLEQASNHVLQKPYTKSTLVPEL